MTAGSARVESGRSHSERSISYYCSLRAKRLERDSEGGHNHHFKVHDEPGIAAPQAGTVWAGAVGVVAAAVFVAGFSRLAVSREEVLRDVDDGRRRAVNRNFVFRL